MLEAQNEIRRLIEENDTSSAGELLAECQEGAVKVGEMIEDSEGEESAFVRLLEEYCEKVYELHEGLSGPDALKRMEDILFSVSKGINDEIKTEREIVFLPYKASMWDSLESVYKELKEKPDVNAIVVPIPYYDKNPDGTFSAEHYEADLFPKDVPLVDYRKYSIEEHHPEAVYIHNPYDSKNFVASVHPDFYSSKLKNETDELVYIPYFILAEIDPKDRDAVERSEHFVIVPGVINAHRVIVQSENWRTVYIDVMTGISGEDTRTYWENKIKAEVSPKLKRVSNLKDEDFELPDDWKKVVFGTGGKKKKVIFYNVTINAMLNENEEMLDKIERVFSVFKENKEDVALLFRPHPLIEATLKSMRPNLFERYDSIVKKYKDEGWGIYDDTPELERAIAVSDAYYGDESSVVWMYKETKKPIMIQSCKV